MSEPINAEVVPETQALVVRPESGAVGILRPADSLDRIADAFKEYQRVCETILDASDYQSYEGKPRKKKSAWRKLATAFNVSTEIMSKEVLRPNGRNVVMAEIRVRASTVGGRQAEALGSCDVNEKCCASARGQKCHKAAWKNHYCCENGCDGRKHWSHPDHDIISTAQTRATNRAIADLIGCGEVSAEELVDDSPNPSQKAPQAPGGVNHATQKTKTPSKPVSAPNSATPGPKLKPPTPATRLWMIEQLDKLGLHDIAVEYFQKIENPSVLMPKEGLADVPLRFVPNCHQEMAMLVTKVKEFANGERAGHAFPPHLDADDVHPAKPAAESLPKGPVKDTEWWRDFIVPIPRKGQKRADYVGNEDTLGSLFDQRHGNDEESQAARQRLWGFVNHYEPKGWVNKDGTKMPPSEVDIKFREALDALAAWFEENHRGEKL